MVPPSSVNMAEENPNEITTSSLQPLNSDWSRYERARALWLAPTGPADLAQVEPLLGSLWTSLQEQSPPHNIISDNAAPKQPPLKNSKACHDEGRSGSTTGSNDHSQSSGCANTTITPTSTTTTSSSASLLRYQVGTRLALWWIQSGGRIAEADAVLQHLGFSCRLSRELLCGAVQATSTVGTSHNTTNIPCRIYDNFLSPSDIDHLSSVFGDIESTYWTDHNYSVEPPSPYYSFVIPLRRKTTEKPSDSNLNGKGDSNNKMNSTSNSLVSLSSLGFLGSLIERLQECVASTWQPLVRTATYAELWAHNRPPATGHQLHWDTDNEGQSGDEQSSNGDTTPPPLRHPLTTCVLYVKAGESAGPTLVTAQRKASRFPADRGWVSHAQQGRMTALDGRVLHCVLPGVPESGLSRSGSGETAQRRVSVMVAFWRRIRVRDLPSPGAARPFPNDRPWAQQLAQKPTTATATTTVPPTPVKPPMVSPVFVNLKGQPWKDGMTEYDSIFQGV